MKVYLEERPMTEATVHGRRESLLHLAEPNFDVVLDFISDKVSVAEFGCQTSAPPISVKQESQKLEEEEQLPEQPEIEVQSFVDVGVNTEVAPAEATAFLTPEELVVSECLIKSEPQQEMEMMLLMDEMEK